MIIQAMIFVTGILAIHFAASQNPSGRMWAGFFGMAGEPFWIASAYPHDQWGVIILAIIHAYMWWIVFNVNRKAA